MLVFGARVPGSRAGHSPAGWEGVLRGAVSKPGMAARIRGRNRHGAWLYVRSAATACTRYVRHAGDIGHFQRVRLVIERS